MWQTRPEYVVKAGSKTNASLFWGRPRTRKLNFNSVPGFNLDDFAGNATSPEPRYGPWRGVCRFG